MLDLELVPERSLGCEQWEFILGMHFSQSVAIIQSQVGIIKGVQVLYNDSNPLQVDLVINLPQDGIRLYFDPVVQRLKIIEIFNMKLVKLKYCGMIFNSPEVLPSIEQIEHSFGATHPGVYDAEKQLFVLNFRGLSFYFPVESKCQTSSTHNLGSLHFPPGSSPLVNRMTIYSGPGVEQASAPELPLSCYHGQLYLSRAEVLRGDCYTKGLRLTLLTGGNTRRIDSGKVQFEREVLLGQTAQDVATSLGAPNMVFYKSEDKMRIHSPNANRRVTVTRSDYFFNYFTLGIDILFDARNHIVKKIVLHTNYPGHYNFNMYQRCEFHLQLNSVEVTAYCRWDELKKQLTPSERPVVLNRASSTNTTNPFGSTFCYGYQDIIFEVMPNNYIASLSMYGDGQPVEGENESA
ncbi:Phagosome assembly factor 1 [Popillia japonica]|uniref:Phagosome assembly factor 1 n=1 Tax=Popillia japonica TaxID=7064 RepID=A0AAW1MEC9_POPJA